ncbi:MAG TPA: endonuclease/exonuclease/phosphatase family protein [Chloroflexaceae bacterium]|mgnify:CR=1 FL=1|nr:endonuclease/exonuclease/phosphatase family protein [Chloroflexaceae bacterium]
MQHPHRFHPVLLAGLAVVGLAIVGAWLGRLHWLGDLLALVVDYSLAVALLLLLAFGWRRAWRWGGIAALMVGLAGAQIASYPRVEPEAPPATERTVRLLVYNLYHLNPDLDAVVATVRRYDPDIVFLMEYSDAVQGQIEGAFADYPHRLIRPSRFTMGLALFSRLPIEAAEVHRAEETRIPVFEARLLAGDKSFTFVGGHPWPPRLQWGALHRGQMGAITRVAAAAEPPLLVAGDFNAAPWSHTVRELAERSEVRLVRRQLDLTKTFYPFPGFGLPLDHVLVSDTWQVLAMEYGPPGGSDHAPLIVDLRLA